MIFKTKKENFFKIMIFGLPVGASIFVLLFAFKVIIFSPFLPFLFFTIFFWIWSFLVWNFTYYEIDNEILKARFGYFFKRKIKITDIIKFDFTITKGRIWGLSQDIVSLKLKNGKELNISPYEKDQFIEELVKRNID